MLHDHPEDADETWGPVRTSLVRGTDGAAAAAIFASTLPDLLEETAAFEIAAGGVPAIAGLGAALTCVRALRTAVADPARLREIAAAARARAAPADGEWLGEGATKELLRSAGIAVPEGGAADDADGCVAIARRIGWPVALKLSAPEIRHKSEAGALVLGIADESELRRACARLRAIPLADGSQLLVERMVEPSIEILVAARADAVVPCLVVGLGGIWTEALDDVAVIALPASPARVEGALRSLRGAPLLTGDRGREPVALEAAAELAVRAGELLLVEGLSLLELNPVAVSADGAVALDALARRRAARRAPAAR